jgi:D-alanine-D-alanine ligase
VRDQSELSAAMKLCFQFDGFGILETFIDGTEWTVGLIDCQVLPPIKIETNREFFDWSAKYEDDDTQYIFDSDISASVNSKIGQAGFTACQALGTRGLARVDVRLDHQFEPWVLEVNTVPGFTDHSLLPKAAAYSGIDFPTLCDRMVQTCRPGQPPAPHIWQTSRVNRSFE